MDPLLQSAEMHLQKAGHEVYWTGDGDLTPRHEEHPAAAKLSGLVEVSRHALFEGAVFNEPIDTSHPTFSALFEYAEAIAVPTFVEFRNGTIHFR
jgi:hypothetical protein